MTTAQEYRPDSRRPGSLAPSYRRDGYLFGSLEWAVDGPFQRTTRSATTDKWMGHVDGWYGRTLATARYQ